MRHGESIANVDGVIVSRPGLEAFEVAGLTATGRAQARNAAVGCGLGGDTVIFTSDFARASQTAVIVADVLGAGVLSTDARLRERFFGVFDKTSAENYREVWACDANNETSPGVEDVHSVLQRTLDLISDLDVQFSNQTVLLVAHGDTLQISQTAYAGIPATAHRSLPPLENAEIRLLTGSGNGASSS